VTRYGRDIDMGYRYGIWDIDIDVDMGYGLSIWAMVYRYDHPPNRYVHHGCRYGIWDIDIGDDNIDSVILDIDKLDRRGDLSGLSGDRDQRAAA